MSYDHLLLYDRDKTLAPKAFQLFIGLTVGLRRHHGSIPHTPKLCACLYFMDLKRTLIFWPPDIVFVARMSQNRTV